MTRGKTRSTGERGVYNVIYGYLDETVGTLAGALAVRLVNHLIVPEDELRLPGRARGVPADQPAGRLRAVHPGHPGRGDRPRHPFQRLNSASLVQLGQGVNQRRIRATMTSIDRVAGRRHRLRQGADEPAAGRRRPAGTGLGRGPHRRRRGPDRPPDRLSGGGQAARRQPRSRGRHQPHRRGGGARRVRRGVRPVPPRLRAGRAVHHRQGLPGAGDRRQHGRDRRAGAGPRDRRRRQDGRRTGGGHQCRPATRRRAREGAHPDRRSTTRPSSWSGRRASRWTRCRRRARW